MHPTSAAQAERTSGAAIFTTELISRLLLCTTSANAPAGAHGIHDRATIRTLSLRSPRANVTPLAAPDREAPRARGVFSSRRATVRPRRGARRPPTGPARGDIRRHAPQGTRVASSKPLG